MSFASDTFTDATSTNLTAHTPQVGGPWAEHPSYGPNILIDDNRAAPVGDAAALDYLSAVPASADYDVTGDVFYENGSLLGTCQAGICGRVSATADTFYMAGVQVTLLGDESWRLRKFVNGAVTVLGTFAENLDPGQTYALKLEMRGSTIKLFRNGVELISVTDTAITAAGLAGIRFNGGLNFHLDNLLAADPPNQSGVGTAEFSFLTSGVGATDALGAGLASFFFAAAGSGSSEAVGGGLAEFVFQSTGEGASDAGTLGAAEFSFAVDGAGAAESAGQGDGSFQFLAAGLGAAAAAGVGQATFEIQAMGAGESLAAGLGAAAFVFSAVAFSAGNDSGIGTAVFSFTATGFGPSVASPAAAIGCFFDFDLCRTVSIPDLCREATLPDLCRKTSWKE